jgi:4-amino-4-deoxy-L-arabinose transferase-like glycosyltransferase
MRENKWFPVSSRTGENLFMRLPPMPQGALMVLAALLLLRVLSLGAYPLADSTESRYANIARLMVESGDWITPQFAPGVPFWGKPPLSTWFAAASMKIFGIGEFGARFPSFLLSVVVLLLVWSMVSHRRNPTAALTASLVLMSSALFFISSGATMTDPALMASTTLCMVSFWRAMSSTQPGCCWPYAFFLGLAAGLLAKGPIALVLTVLPIGVWILWQKQWGEMWRRLPWIRGLALTLLLSLPWYLLAELKTPGFLEYFFIGEHWKRFTVPGWTGDLYGSAHTQPKGMIWLYGLAGVIPWSFLMPIMLMGRENRRNVRSCIISEQKWFAYLACWAITPLLFFTPAGNILWTYFLPGLPAFAILATDFFYRPPKKESASILSPLLFWGSSGMLISMTCVLALVVAGYGLTTKSQKELIAVSQKYQGGGFHLTYLYERPFSADFYSQGKAGLIKNPTEAMRLMHNDQIDFFAVDQKLLKSLPPIFLEQVTNLGPINGTCLLIENSPVQRP